MCLLNLVGLKGAITWSECDICRNLVWFTVNLDVCKILNKVFVVEMGPKESFFKRFYHAENLFLENRKYHLTCFLKNW